MNLLHYLAPRLLTAIYFANCWYGANGKTCYGTDGNELPGVVDCDPSANVSACCAPGDYCYSNGLCGPSSYSPNVTYLTKYYYNGCTDPTYQNAICLSECKTSGGIGVKTCPDVGFNAYCCYGQSNCDCNAANEVFTLAAGTIVTLLPKTTSVSTPTTGTSSHTVTTPASSPSSSSSSGSSSSSTSAASTAPTEGSPDSNHEKSNALPIGLGVGIGTLVAIIGVVAGLWIRWKAVNRRNRQEFLQAGFDGKAEVEGRPMFRTDGAPLLHGNSAEMEAKTRPAVQHELYA